MSAAALLSLAWQTIVAPREVARLLISLRLSREVLLTGFALVVVLNALIVGLMQLGGEVPAGHAARTPCRWGCCWPPCWPLPSP